MKNILVLFSTALLVLIVGKATTQIKTVSPTLSDTITLKTLIEPSPAMQELVVKQTKDTSLKIYYSKPAGAKPGKKYPAIIWIHGGGWSGGDAKTFFPHAKYFALRNAVGFSIEYRLVKYQGSGLAECLADCKSAIRFIRAHAKELNVDPDQIIVLGDSAGGHLAACLGTMDGELGFDDPTDNLAFSAKPNAMVLYNPCVDMSLYPLMKNVLKQTVADIKSLDSASIKASDWQMAKRFSPLFYVKANQPSCIVLHGLNDKVIPAEQSIRFTEAMKKAGNSCELVLLPETRHAFVVPNYTASEEAVVNAIVAGDRFLTKIGYLKGEPTLRVSDVPSWSPRKK